MLFFYTFNKISIHSRGGRKIRNSENKIKMPELGIPATLTSRRQMLKNAV